MKRIKIKLLESISKMLDKRIGKR